MNDCTGLPGLRELIDAARGFQMTDHDREAQRRSFVYGNNYLANDRITRELVEQMADALAQRTLLARLAAP